MKKKVLITGGAGFIGASIVKELIRSFKDHFEIVVFDMFNSQFKRENGNFRHFGDFRNLIDLDVEIVVGDISKDEDLEKLFSNKFDIIFHQAAISDTTVQDQYEVMKTNFSSFNFIVDYCAKHKAKLIYASSAGVYGKTDAPNKVGQGEFPENIYGFSKLQMDNLTRSRLRVGDVQIVGLRYFNVYGPGEMFKGSTSSMVLQLARQALKNRRVRLFKYGEQSRDFVYIDDIVNANILAINGQSGVYNVGSGVARSFNDIVDIIERNFGFDVEREYFDNPYEFFQLNTSADLTDTKRGLGFSPKFTLEMGMQAYLDNIKGLV